MTIKVLLSICLLFIYFCESTQFLELQTPLPITSPYFPTPSPPYSQRRSLNTNIENLLTIGSKSGTQPTIVAIPLYIRNNLSAKYPSLLEILSTSLLQNGVKTNKKYTESQSNGKSKPVNENSNYNEFKPNYTTQRYQSPPQKTSKYIVKDEQKFVRHHPREESIHTSPEANSAPEYSSQYKSRPHSQSTYISASNSPPINQYLDPIDKMTFLRSPVPSHRYTAEQERKQNPIDVNSGITRYDANKPKDIPNNEQNDEKSSESSDKVSADSFNANTDTRREPTYGSKSYPSVSVSIDNKDFNRNRGQEKNSFNSLQTHSDNTDENMDFRFIDTDDNYNNNPKNDNKYQNTNYNNDYEMSNKSPDFQSRSPVSYVRPIDRFNYYTQPINTYTVRPVVQKPNFDMNITPKPYLSSSISSMYPMSESHNIYNNPSYQSQTSTNYNSDFQPITSITSNHNPNSQTMATNHNTSPLPYNNYNSNSDSLPNTYNLNSEPKTQYNSVSQPIYLTQSKDYSTQEEDCYEDNDYKSSPQTTRSPTNEKSDIYEMTTKLDDSESNDDTEDFDPTKLDLKIVHLPVSLLRRLISNGNIALPGFQ